MNELETEGRPTPAPAGSESASDGPGAVSQAASIIVTNYNYERYLVDAVTSALGQSVRCQVIVVDDGSSDGSSLVLDQLERDHPELVVIRNQNGGQASAMNSGWAQAVAPYVLFLDADDRLAQTAVAEVVSRFTEEPDVDHCLFRLRWIDDAGVAIDGGGFPEPGRPLPDGDLRARMAVGPDDIPWQPTTGNAFRRSALDRFMPIPEPPYRISADHYLSNLSALTGPVTAIETVLGDYRVHGDNADHRPGFDLVRARSILIRTEETREQLIKHGPALGVDMPRSTDGFRSLTTAAMRLVSYRVGDGHPFDGDRRLRLVMAGLRAAMGRRDLSPARRLVATGWVIALGFGPTTMVEAIAGRGLNR